VLRRALALARGSRHPTAAAFLTDLEDVVEGRVVTGLPTTVAVLDLENLSGDDEMDWLGTAVAESLRARLSGIAGATIVTREKLLRVLQSRTERDATERALEVGRQAGCGCVIFGSFRTSGRSLIVTMCLLDVPTGRTTITNPVDASVDEIFALEDQLASAVAASLGLTLSPLARARAKSIEAYEWFIRARRLLDRLSKGAVDQARELLDRAVAIDPNYVPALAALANAYGFRSIATTDPDDLDRALHFADRAIAIDRQNAEAYTWRGYALMRQNRFADAAFAYRRASELDPTHAMSHYFAGSNLLFLGRAAEGLPLLQRAVELDARTGMLWLGLGAAHLSLRQLAEARYSFGRARDLEVEPVRFGTAGAEAYIAEVLRLEGHLEDARDHALRGLESVERSDHAYRDTFRAHALVVLGRTGLDRGDPEAARAAFGQVLAQAQGRPRTRSCGQLVVRALAGLAVANGATSLFQEACRLYDAGETYNFEPFFGALDHQSLYELARTAHALDRAEEARDLLVRARDAGCLHSLPAAT
jgi:tetratricopeptide (TPR) repeat protein